MLQASDVWFGYVDTQPVLRGVSVDVPSGSIVGILGPNGSGKTTLLRILAGTRQPQRGHVTFDGAPLTRFSRSALAQIDPSGILLLDEPTASLDLRYQVEIADLLRRLHRERNVSIVISTHDLALAGALCHWLVLLRNGAVIASGQTDDVFTRDNIRTVYEVDADIIYPQSAARVVIPIRRGRD